MIKITLKQNLIEASNLILWRGKAIRITLIVVKIRWEKAIIFSIFGRLQLRSVATDKLFLLTILCVWYEVCIMLQGLYLWHKGVFVAQGEYLWYKGYCWKVDIVQGETECYVYLETTALASTINHVVHSNAQYLIYCKC